MISIVMCYFQRGKLNINSHKIFDPIEMRPGRVISLPQMIMIIDQRVQHYQLHAPLPTSDASEKCVIAPRAPILIRAIRPILFAYFALRQKQPARTWFLCSGRMPRKTHSSVGMRSESMWRGKSVTSDGRNCSGIGCGLF